jgi:hypothetical protein
MMAQLFKGIKEQEMKALFEYHSYSKENNTPLYARGLFLSLNKRKQILKFVRTCLLSGRETNHESTILALLSASKKSDLILR